MKLQPSIQQLTFLAYSVVQKIMENKINLFSHICRMPDDRLLKQVVFRIMEGSNRRGRPIRERKRMWKIV